MVVTIMMGLGPVSYVVGFIKPALTTYMNFLVLVIITEVVWDVGTLIPD